MGDSTARLRGALRVAVHQRPAQFTRVRASSFAIAFGILLDTIVVRSVLVTALDLDIGRWMWWPSKLAHTPDPAPAERGHERAAALTRS